jgi:hypothetical protein
MCAAVAALFLWLTSFDCMVCCFVDGLRSANSACEVATTSAHPSCCEEAAEASPSTDPASGTFARLIAVEGQPAPCTLLATSYGQAETPKSADRDTSAAPAALAGSAPNVLAGSPAPVRRPAHVANRGDTYLRCRVLLI